MKTGFLDFGHDPFVPRPESWFHSFSNRDVIKKNASFSQSDFSLLKKSFFFSDQKDV